MKKKYYRFISQDELDYLYKHGHVENKTTRPLFILEENPKTKILTDNHNYNLTMTEYFSTNALPYLNFTKENFMKYMIGTISEDYLLELELDYTPSMYNLGWYHYKTLENDTDQELCVLETCISHYTLAEVKAIYIGDFYNWQNIKEMKKGTM